MATTKQKENKARYESDNKEYETDYKEYETDYKEAGNHNPIYGALTKKDTSNASGKSTTQTSTTSDEKKSLTFDDFKKAMEAGANPDEWLAQHPDYVPGEKTKAWINDYKNNHRKPYSGIDATEDVAIQKSKKDVDENIQRNKDARAAKGSYEDQNRALYEQDDGADARRDRSNAYDRKYNVSPEQGSIGYDSIFSVGADAVDSIGKYKDAIDSNTSVKQLKRDKEIYKGWKDDAKSTIKSEDKLRGSVTKELEGKQKENAKAKAKLHDKLDGYSKDKTLSGMEDQLKGYDEQIQNNAWSQFLKENGEDESQWDESVRMAAEAMNPEDAEAFQQLQAQRSELQTQINDYKAQVAEAMRGDQTQLSELILEGGRIAKALGSVESSTLNELGTVIENYGTEDQKDLLDKVQQAYAMFQEDTGIELSKETYQMFVDGLNNAKKAIRDEINNDLAIGDARKAMVNDLNKFLFFAVDDILTGIAFAYAIQIGNPMDIVGKLTEMGKRNAAYSNAEAGFKTGILNNEGENLKLDQTGQATADFTRIQNEVDLEKYLGQLDIDAGQAAREIEGMKEAWKNFRGSPEDFRAWYTLREAQKSGGSGWTGIISSLIQSGALNWDVIMKVLQSGENTGSDEALKTDIVKTGGRVNKWMDSAFNNSKQQPVEDNSAENDAILRMDKQQVFNTINMQKQQSGGQPANAQGPAPAKGWGK